MTMEYLTKKLFEYDRDPYLTAAEQKICAKIRDLIEELLK